MQQQQQLHMNSVWQSFLFRSVICRRRPFAGQDLSGLAIIGLEWTSGDERTSLLITYASKELFCGT